MSVKVSDKKVKNGDMLYNTAMQMWGEIIGVDDDGTAQMLFRGAGRNNELQVTITDGGYLHGKRVIYWHEPLRLDIAIKDISAYQAVIDVMVKNRKGFSDD